MAKTAKKKVAAKKRPYKKTKKTNDSAKMTNAGRKEASHILKNYSFEPDPTGKGKRLQPYDAVISMDSPTNQGEHARLSMSLSSFFKKNPDLAYLAVAFGYDSARFSHGGRGTADLVAVFDSTDHVLQNAPIKHSGKNVHSRRHIATIMRVLRLKLPERGQKKEIFLAFDAIGENIYRISELKDFTREVKSIKTGE